MERGSVIQGITVDFMLISVKIRSVKTENQFQQTFSWKILLILDNIISMVFILHQGKILI